MSPSASAVAATAAAHSFLFLYRMFSYSTFLVNNNKLENIDTINDEDIIPSTGTNPFKAGGLTLSGNGNTYELYVTPKGDQGYTNELKYASDGK